jgi:transcriptional regulator of acetoin/glycerol metabolism
MATNPWLAIDAATPPADSMNFTEGALRSENGAGTNAIGTALAADHALRVFDTEHFVEVVQAGANVVGHADER